MLAEHAMGILYREQLRLLQHRSESLADGTDVRPTQPGGPGTRVGSAALARLRGRLASVRSSWGRLGN